MVKIVGHYGRLGLPLMQCVLIYLKFFSGATGNESEAVAKQSRDTG